LRTFTYPTFSVVQLFCKISQKSTPYGVATLGRLLQIIGLVCKRALFKRLYSAKETYNLKGLTNRSHPILEVNFTLQNIVS